MDLANVFAPSHIAVPRPKSFRTIFTVLHDGNRPVAFSYCFCPSVPNFASSTSPRPSPYVAPFWNIPFTLNSDFSPPSATPCSTPLSALVTEPNLLYSPPHSIFPISMMSPRFIEKLSDAAIHALFFIRSSSAPSGPCPSCSLSYWLIRSAYCCPYVVNASSFPCVAAMLNRENSFAIVPTPPFHAPQLAAPFPNAAALFANPSALFTSPSAIIPFLISRAPSTRPLPGITFPILLIPFQNAVIIGSLPDTSLTCEVSFSISACDCIATFCSSRGIASFPVASPSSLATFVPCASLSATSAASTDFAIVSGTLSALNAAPIPHVANTSASISAPCPAPRPNCCTASPMNSFEKI